MEQLIQIIENLKSHYKKNWEFEKINEKLIRMKFKKDNRCKIILAPRINIIQYRFGEETRHSYEYLSEDINNKIAREVLNGLRCFYPNPIKENSNYFDAWIDDWMHDYKKRNKRARELYGFEKR